MLARKRDSMPDRPFARWRALSNVPEEERLVVLFDHPRFEEAARALSRGMLALAAGDKALDGIVKDIGRFAATMMAIYLHATGGLTLPRLKALCAEGRLISPGRARAILLYLRFLKFVEPAQGGRRAGLYVPTAGLQQAWRAIEHCALAAAQIVEPDIAQLLPSLDEPDAMHDLVRFEFAISLAPGRRGGTTDNALWRVFLNRHAGTQILHALMQGAEPDDSYPPQGAMRYALSKLAREFNVSRPHVARMLRAAESEGLVVLEDGNALRFTPEGRREAAILLALRLSTSLHAAVQLYEERERSPLRRTG
jgi:AraC-like DNA-binding protein